MQKVAVVGAGGMGNVHCAAYTDMPNVELVAVMDIRTEAAEATSKLHGCKPFTDFDEMLSAVNPDVIDVCTPTPWHKEYVLRAADAKKHIVTEKPMARTVEDCYEMMEAAKRAGVKFMVAHVLRFFPEFATAKAQIDAGAVGKPAVVRTSRGGGYPFGSNDWFGNFEWSGGAVLDLIIHDFDWLRWTFGEVERIYAKGLIERNLKHMDHALVTLRFKSGVIAHVEGTWLNPTGFVVTFEVVGDGGMLQFSNQTAVPLVVARTKTEEKEAGVPIPESPTMQNPYFQELQHFIDCVENGAKPCITPEDGMRAVEISLAALESIRTGLPVNLTADGRR
ncbi:MAG: Gfo/Idh/MocA family oxidoreductase [Armatimonadota bacterium]|nr:Gfo/Idh/MocA family oxidoreductase [Armatimonadota bacterium]